MTSCIRQPAVARQFYPADPEQLKALVNACLQDICWEPGRCRAAAAVAVEPHGGWAVRGPS